MQKAKQFKEFVLLKTKSLREISISNIFITANNREFGSPFHSLQSNSRGVDCVIHGVDCVIHVAYVS